jgi:hypothetical protein
MHPKPRMPLSAMREREERRWRPQSNKKKPKTKTKNQTKAHETRPAQCNKRKLSSPKQCNDNNTLYQKTLTAEMQFFQMRKMNQRWRKRDASFVADAVICNAWEMEREERRWRPQSNKKKPKTQNQKPKTKQNRMKHALLNATNANSAAQSNAPTTTHCIQKHLRERSRTSKWERWTKDDESAMHPSAPNSLAAMCDGWRGRSGGGGPNQTKNQKPKPNIKQKRMKHALLNATNANSAAQSNATTTTRRIQKHLLLRSSAFKWERWTRDDESAMHPSSPMPLSAMRERWRGRSGGGGPNQTKKNQKPKPKTKPKQKRMKHALLNATNANSAAQSNATTTTRRIQKHLLWSFRNSKWERWTKDDESAMHPSSPMPLPAMCERWRGRSGGGGPNQTKKTKNLNQNQNQTKAHETRPAQCNKHKLSSPKQCNDNNTPHPKTGGPNQTKKSKTKTKNQNQTKPHETRPAQCNTRKLSSPKQCNDNNTPYPKTLTAQTQFFQMRKMNQRWRKRDASFVADAIICNAWGMEREERRWRPQSNKKKPKTKTKNQTQTKAHDTRPAQCNKRKLSSPKQCNDNNTPHPKTLTEEFQKFQMRKMNQRWRKRDASFGADAVLCNVWEMEREERWWRPKSNKKTKNPKSKTKQNRMKHALLNATNANSAAQSNATTTTRSINKQLPWRYSPFKWERWTKHDKSAMHLLAPMPLPAMCERWRGRSGGGGPNQTNKPKPKIKTKPKQNRMTHALLNATNANSAAQSNATTTTRSINKQLRWRYSPFKWERWTKHDESAMHPKPPMPFSAMCEGWRGRSGGGGPNQTKKNQKPKIKNQTKPHETRPAQCNKRKLSSPKQCTDNNTLHPKTLTREIQNFQMRKMNQRWRKRDAS